jgi:hypothetical protein
LSVEYTYDEGNNVLYTRFFGVVTNLDLRDQAQAIGQDPRVKSGVRELVDLEGVEEVASSSTALDDVICIDCENSAKLAGMRTAVVASRDFIFGFARMYKSLAEIEGSPATVQVFRTFSEARQWLGLENDG